MSTTNPTEVSTEWDELQVKYGNFVEKPKPITNEVLTNCAIDFAETRNVLEGKNLEELEKLEDDVEEDTLEVYRQKRLAELKKKKEAYRFGEMVHVGKCDYLDEVTNASKSMPGQRVVLLLYSNSKPICELMIRALTEVAKRHGDVKFCKAIGTDVIANYPEAQVPTVIIYKDGVCETQLTGASIWGGLGVSADCAEWVLWKQGVVSAAASEEDPRPNRKEKNTRLEKGIRYDDESDEDERNEDRRGYSSLALEKALRLR